MEKDKRNRLILFASLLTVAALGTATKLVKVKTNKTVVKLDYAEPKKAVRMLDDGVEYFFTLPRDYVLNVNEKGEIVGCKTTTENKEVEVSLGEYLVDQIIR